MSSTQQRVLGQVKWFNNKAGYGFITVSEGEQEGKEIFVHFSAIRVTNSQYKYLIQGEYVEFLIEKSNSDVHELQAIDITGVKGGKLMCEARFVNVSQEGNRERRASPAGAFSRGGRGGNSYRRYKVQNNKSNVSDSQEQAVELNA